VKRITSRDNPQYQGLRRIAHSTKARREEGRTILDGVHLLQAYVAAFGADGVQVILRDASIDYPEIASLVTLRGVANPLVLTDSLFDTLSPVESPVGVMAAVPLRPPKATATAQTGFSVFVDGVQDPGNLGSILRSAAAAGAKQVMLSAQCADAWSPKCLRGGMGAQFQLVVHEEVDLDKAAGRFAGRLIATDAAAEESLYQADLSGAVGFILGAEGAGVSPTLRNQAHIRVRIPMESGIESLNVAAAATVLFFEWRRRLLTT
jgi:TrmH family RNA methyltransferase